MDWALLIRTLFGAAFIFIGYRFSDWLPAIFGLAIILIGVIAAVRKTGCGYTDECSR